MRIRRRMMIAAMLIAAMVSGTGAQSGLGVLSFPNSGAAPAQPHFITGVASLHSFAFDDATDAFKEAQRLDPAFALAYWGEAMSYNHALWSEVDVPAGQQALNRLAPTLDGRLAKAPTGREKDLLRAVDLLFFGPNDKLAREVAYSAAMERMYSTYPGDHEVAVLYALSLLGTVRPGEPGMRRQVRAAAIAQDVLRQNPKHPGAAHFLIHALDDPDHAPMGLPAANVYAQIAPGASHAQHMPSHIFVQLGMWKEAAASNRAAYAASEAWVERRKASIVRKDFHSLSWLHYAYLQVRDMDAANQTLQTIRAVVEKTGDARVREALATMHARHIVESGAWEKLPVRSAAAGAAHGGGEHAMHQYDASAAVLLASGLSAARLGDAAAAASAQKLLQAEREKVAAGGNAYRAKVLSIMEKQVAAAASFQQGRRDEGLNLAKEAAELEMTTNLPNGLPEPIKPAPELYGELLLEANRPQDARAQFDAALTRMPNRTASLLGSARASVRANDVMNATRRYTEVERSLAAANVGHADLNEAREYLKRAGK